MLRYAGCKAADDAVQALLNTCIAEVRDKLTYKVCYCTLPLSLNGDVCDFDAFSLRSKRLAANLKNCEQVVLFAATIGVEIDRLIAKYGRTSPSKALMFQAIGAERIESLCDTFCADISNELKTSLRPRFSPGYGDLPLSAQEEVFALLNCAKHIGLTLNDSLIMSPSKSVTAFIGLSCDNKPIEQSSPCNICDKQSCAFRGAL
jgi:hypothetical protein